ELERREAALRQQMSSIGDETSALVKQSEELALQLEGLRGEKLRLEVRQRELEQEWDAARTRVTQTEDHLRMGRQSLQELCEQRFTFLTRERDDLLQSIADTQQAIAELDLATKEKFEHAFHAINKSFSEAFHTIFGGGMAEMRLTEPDSSGDAGIDIVASPP